MFLSIQIIRSKSRWRRRRILRWGWEFRGTWSGSWEARRTRCWPGTTFRRAECCQVGKPRWRGNCRDLQLYQKYDNIIIWEREKEREKDTFDNTSTKTKTCDCRKSDKEVIDFSLFRFRFDLETGSDDRPEEGGRSESNSDRSKKIFDENRVSDELEVDTDAHGFKIGRFYYFDLEREVSNRFEFYWIFIEKFFEKIKKILGRVLCYPP